MDMDDDYEVFCDECHRKITDDYFVAYKGYCCCSECEHDFFMDFIRFDLLTDIDEFRKGEE